jgi:hypothetical protein
MSEIGETKGKDEDRLPAEMERRLLRVFVSWLGVMGLILAGIAGGAAYLLNASIIEAGKTNYQRLAYEQLGGVQQRIALIDSQLSALLKRTIAQWRT